MTEPINIVWLKRDLRVRDHEPLLAAARDGRPFVLLYCFEPSVMVSPKHGPRHWRFVAQCLEDLIDRGYPVTIWWGEVVEALSAIRALHRIETIFSHQETGHRLTFLRDRAVRDWCRAQHLMWWEFVQDGVIRGRQHRQGFAEHVNLFLASSQVKSEVEIQDSVVVAPDLPVATPQDGFGEDFTRSKEATALAPQVPGLWAPSPEPAYGAYQIGGERNAWRYLRSFTRERGQGYAYKLGNPTLSRTSCSRMSVYLAYGCISVRDVFRWAKEVRGDGQTAYDLKMFRERLWWRAHYFQKLEAEWRIETEPINRAFRSLYRHQSAAGARHALTAFKEGNTGVPMIDANVRCLRHTGWINFRSRAMLVTFSIFGLALDWREVSAFLASNFLDYDPGIHYGQIQMQAGLTGYHPPRNYNPYLQGEKYDPEGAFVHRWLPELRNVPPPFCHYPHRLTSLERALYGLRVEDYPAPIVDYAQASRENMERYWAVRNSAEARANLPAIWRRHVLPSSIEKYKAGEVVSPRRDV